MRLRPIFFVTYREFDGGHTVPPEIAREAVSWFLSASRTSPRVREKAV